MPNYFLCNLKFKWDLVRETPYSQKFIVDVAYAGDIQAMFDIHYTKPEIAYTNVCLIGPKILFTDSLCNRLFDDLELIVKRHGDYRVIDYSLVYSDDFSNGNYTIK